MSIDLSESARGLLAAPRIAHLVTIEPDGSPQVSGVWVGLDDDEAVFASMGPRRKLDNIARDPRVALSVTELGNPYRMAAVQGRVVEVRDD